MPQPRKRPPSGKVTAKEQRLIDEYLIDQDASAAYRRTGYTGKNARILAYQVLKRPHVRAALAAALKAQQERTLIAADRNLVRIDRLAAKAEAAGEFAASIRASELIGKHYRSFTDKVELTGVNDGPVEFTEIRRTIVRPDKA